MLIVKAPWIKSKHCILSFYQAILWSFHPPTYEKLITILKDDVQHLKINEKGARVAFCLRSTQNFLKMVHSGLRGSLSNFAQFF